MGVMTSHLPEIVSSADGRGKDEADRLQDKPYKLPDVRNVVRRMRTRLVRSEDEDTFFFGRSESSFNSRCSDRYFREDLGENSRHYYFFQTFPRLTDAGAREAVKTGS